MATFRRSGISYRSRRTDPGIVGGFHDRVPALAHPAGGLLAAGAPGAGPLPADLAAAPALPAPGLRRGGGLRAGEGAVPAAGPAPGRQQAGVRAGGSGYWATNAAHRGATTRGGGTHGTLPGRQRNRT